MILKTLFFIVCLNAFCYGDDFKQVALYKREVHADIGLNVPELVAKYGYPIKTHTITTQDGYILTVHHIPHGKHNTDISNRPVIFLMHGLLCSSADWVLAGPEKGLAFLLADRGYDVWMGNARGNTYSRKHIKLNPDVDRKKFWDFSWHEIGIYDVPAMIDHVLEKTGQKNLYYIGHSQGTTAFFVMTSTYPQYNDKIRLMIAMGPAVYMNHIPNIGIRFIAKSYKIARWTSRWLGPFEFFPSTNLIQKLGSFLCNDKSIIQDLCSNILFLIAGFDYDQMNKTILPVILSNTPAGASTKQILHFAQLYNSGKFSEYDYGFGRNFLRYGKFYPPNYDLGKVSAPVALFYGKNDLLVSEIDVHRISDKIQNTVLMYEVQYDKFNHLDFLWSTNVVPLLYNKVFDLLEKFEK